MTKKGLSAGRNTGTIQANGDYIFYLDSDDEITPDCISLLVNEVKKHPDVQIVQGEVKSIPMRDYYDTTHLSAFSFIDDNDWVRYRFFKDTKRLPINAWNKLVQKDFIIKNKLYFKDGIIHEDELWMIQKIALQKRYFKRLVMLYLIMLTKKIGKGYHTVETMISNLK